MEATLSPTDCRLLVGGNTSACHSGVLGGVDGIERVKGRIDSEEPPMFTLDEC